MKKSNKIILNIIFLLVLGMSASCTKKNFEDHVGPSICPTANFQYVQQPQVSNASVDFTSQSQVLTAVFNEEVKWSLVIRGVTSKSFKKYSGYGKAINITWKGNPDTLVFFQAEQCNAEFTVACKETIVKTFNITTVSNFANFNYLIYNGDGGALALGPYSYGAYATHTVTPGLNSPQGGNCYCTAGNSSGTPVWFFGGYDFTTNLGNAVGTDPSKVYFNCFINVQGSVGTAPVVTFKEDLVSRSKTIMLTGNGWHYVSFKLSDVNVVNPRNINTVSFGLNAYPEQATAGNMCVDFVSFTNDSPFITVP